MIDGLAVGDGAGARGTRYWPFVGRDREQAAIRSAFDGDIATGVVVIGDAGAGKTRLVREMTASFAAEGLPTAWVAGTESLRSIPFGAVAHLLPDDWRHRGDRLEALTAVAARMRAMGAGGRAVIAFDDAHLVDQGTAALIAHLAAQRLVFMLITVRCETTPPDAVTALWKDGSAELLNLSALPAQAIDALVDGTLGADVEGLTRQRMHRLVAGNPLALGELLAQGTATGALRQTYGVWRLTAHQPLARILPALVASRIRPPAALAQRVLDVLACGEPLPLGLVEALADEKAVEAAEADGHVLVEADGVRTQVRLAHPLYGDVLRAAMPASRFRRIQRELARAALARPLRRRGDALRVSIWQVDGGAVDRPEVVRAGAREAMNRSDLELAERLARAARDAEPGAESDHLLAQILGYRGRTAEAVALLEARRPTECQVRWEVTWAETLYWGAGDVAGAERALDSAAADPAGAELANATRSWILLFDGRCADALAVARRLLAGDASRPQVEIWAAAAAIAAAGFLGRCDEAGELYARGRRAAEPHATAIPLGVSQVDFAWCLALLANGELSRANAVAEQAYRRAVGSHISTMAGGFAGLRGLVVLAAGRPVEASRLLREAVATLSDNDTFRLVRSFLGGLAMASALTGDAVAAGDWLDQADRRASSANRLFGPWLELSRAWIAAAHGANGKAATIAMRAADLARDAGLPTVEAQARYDAVRLGALTERLRIGELHAALDLPWTEVLATATEGVHKADGDLLRRAANGFARLGHRLHAAESASVASMEYRRAGRRGSAAAAQERAITLREGCEGAATPLLTLGGSAGVLTRREREVALLAVRYTSRDIADRLGLSTTTVNNNLARVYAKLGVAGRVELGELLDLTL